MHSLGKRGWATPADVRALAVVLGCCEIAIEEDRQLELLADQRRRRERLGAGGPAGALVVVHDRRHVNRADMRVGAAVAAQIDPRHGRTGARQQRLGQLSLRRGKAVDAAAVVGIGVQVEQPRGRERSADRVDRPGVCALANVGHREQQRAFAHRRYPSTSRAP